MMNFRKNNLETGLRQMIFLDGLLEKINMEYVQITYWKTNKEKADKNTLYDRVVFSI